MEKSRGLGAGGDDISSGVNEIFRNLINAWDLRRYAKVFIKTIAGKNPETTNLDESFVEELEQIKQVIKGKATIQTYETIQNKLEATREQIESRIKEGRGIYLKSLAEQIAYYEQPSKASLVDMKKIDSELTTLEINKDNRYYSAQLEARLKYIELFDEIAIKQEMENIVDIIVDQSVVKYSRNIFDMF